MLNKKLIAAIAAGLIVLAFAATLLLTWSPDTSSSAPPNNTNAPAAAHVANLNGKWTADLNNSTMVATITDDGIEIQWATGNDSALYWKGTFKVPSSIGSKFDVVSVADQGAMQESILASQDTMKTFTYEHGKITFILRAVGVTTKVELHK